MPKPIQHADEMDHPMSNDDPEGREQDLEILRLLVQGEKEIAAGKGHDLDEVLAEADDLAGGQGLRSD